MATTPMSSTAVPLATKPTKKKGPEFEIGQRVRKLYNGKEFAICGITLARGCLGTGRGGSCRRALH